MLRHDADGAVHQDDAASGALNLLHLVLEDGERRASVKDPQVEEKHDYTG